MTPNEFESKFIQFTDAIAENIGVPIEYRRTDVVFGRRIWVCQFGDYGNIRMDDVALQKLSLDDVEHYASKLVNIHVDANSNNDWSG